MNHKNFFDLTNAKMDEVKFKPVVTGRLGGRIIW